MNNVYQHNEDGTWTPAVPLPIYLPFYRYECVACGYRCFGRKRYELHYRGTHL